MGHPRKLPRLSVERARGRVNSQEDEIILRVVTILSLAAVAMTAAPAKATSATKQKGMHCTQAIQGVKFYRSKTWEHQRFIGQRLTPTQFHETKSKSCRYIRWVANRWRQRAHASLAQFQKPPHYREWMCIHHYEGSWTDPNAPFYGGLQMDYGFQEAYGPELLRTKGTADHWTPLEQMWVAERAYKTRGFYPWPNTAHYCGLI